MPKMIILKVNLKNRQT